ncbi:MAG TPA: CBS domain-containing protein [Pirellulales bacterium]|nr:CBS domain-containing protein [Pirellulales bacterium]
MDYLVNFTTDTVDDCPLVEPVCVAPTSTARDALEKMKEQNSAAVLVCESQKIVGIFTERDALAMMASQANFDRPIEEVMTRDPVVLHSKDTVGKAISAMTRGGYRRLPIVDTDGKPSGLIKIESILHYIAEHFPKLVYNLPPEPHHSTREREGA